MRSFRAKFNGLITNIQIRTAQHSNPYPQDSSAKLRDEGGWKPPAWARVFNAEIY